MNYLQEFYQSASNCCRNCPCGDSPAGFQCQPYHLPGYLGHVPTLRVRFGHTYSKLTRDSLQDPCAPASPCPMLTPESWTRCCPMYSTDDCRLQMKGQLGPRCCQTDIYRSCERMNETYAGHVPGFSSVCLDGNPSRNTPNKIYLHNTGINNQACYQRCEYDDNHEFCRCMDADIAAQKRAEREAGKNPSKKSKSKKDTPTASASQKDVPAKSSKSRVSIVLKKISNAFQK